MINSEDKAFMEDVQAVLLTYGIRAYITPMASTYPQLFKLEIMDVDQYEQAMDLLFSDTTFAFQLQQQHQSMLLERRGALESWSASLLKSKYYWYGCGLAALILIGSFFFQ